MDDYFDLGRHSRPITTRSAAAQRWFDRGLVWCYGFNQEEGAVCFKNAAACDPDCAMAHWGVAFASGPFYNMTWDLFSPPEAEAAVVVCYAAAQRALACAAATTPVEQGLIRALARRFQAGHVVSLEEFTAWDDAFADAMRAVHADFPEDLDVIALFAEAMMTRTPWRLWDVHRDQPTEGADTLEVMRVLEAGLDLIERRGLDPHPGILHMYIHAMEMSPTPERALRAADTLRDVVPDAGHLQHMPSHIYMLCGLYHESCLVNEKAIAADMKFLAYAGPHNFYTTSRCHDFHLMMFAGMFLGRYRTARAAADGIAATLPPGVLCVDKPYMAATLEGYYAMRMHVPVRFGRWREIIEAPLPDDPELYCVSLAMDHYAKGVAHAALAEIAAAEAEKQRFQAACAAIPPGRFFFNNLALDTLAVAAAMLDGELAYRKGEHAAAFAHLRRAVDLEDWLHYSEPRSWMHPPRHALGALLLEQGHVVEAAVVYRADLGLDDTLNRCSRHPDNVWCLHGYVECLRRLGEDREAAMMQQRLDLALARTDVAITASCCCRGQGRIAAG